MTACRRNMQYFQGGSTVITAECRRSSSRYNSVVGCPNGINHRITIRRYGKRHLASSSIVVRTRWLVARHDGTSSHFAPKLSGFGYSKRRRDQGGYSSAALRVLPRRRAFR